MVGALGNLGLTGTVVRTVKGMRRGRGDRSDWREGMGHQKIEVG